MQNAHPSFRNHLATTMATATNTTFETLDRLNTPTPRAHLALFAQATFCLVFSLLLISPCLAQEDDDRPATETLLPETTIALMKVTNFTEFFAKMKTSLGAQMLEDESVAPLAKQLYETAEDQYSRVEETVGMSLDELKL